MRPLALKMPLQVKLRIFDAEDQTIELPDDATILSVKKWVAEYNGVAPEQQRVIVAVGSKVLKNEDRLNSNAQFLNLKVVNIAQ
jgi:hypothetical protein